YTTERVNSADGISSLGFVCCWQSIVTEPTEQKTAGKDSFIVEPLDSLRVVTILLLLLQLLLLMMMIVWLEEEPGYMSVRRCLHAYSCLCVCVCVGVIQKSVSLYALTVFTGGKEGSQNEPREQLVNCSFRESIAQSSGNWRLYWLARVGVCCR
ncbi:unnamed protein product, partial [Protopolystoma xenopodis]